MKSRIYSLLLVLILTLFSCEKETGTKPIVVTSPVDLVTFTTAQVGGNVTESGISSVTDRGVWWGSTSNPQTDGQKVSIGSGTGVFSASIDGLSEKTKYYVQAFATNDKGTSFGEVVSFTTGGNDGTYTDPRNGSVYSYKNIGTQTWMVKNLDYLPTVSPSTLASETEKFYYVFDYEGTDVNTAKSSEKFTTYGVLYNWPAAINACPAGWHLPTDAEWKILEVFLGMDQTDADIEGSRTSGSVGLKMKSNTGWMTGGDGNNTSGLTALPGGFTYPGGSFGGSNVNAQFWSSTEKNASLAWTRTLNYAGAGVDRVAPYKSRGFSVRCLKDK